MTFEKATKRRSKLRLALTGTSGTGKTYSALSVAQALGSKVALIDTEHGSASKYADLFTFDVLELETFHPQKYIDGIKEAEKDGYDVLIIDSLTHAWSGKGGALELVDQGAKRSGNKFTAWGDVTPLQNLMIDTILASKMHVIVTMRSKTEYVLEAVEKGGKTTQVPRKIGMAPVQRDGVDYEFDVVGDLTVSNELFITKTRCPALSGVTIEKPGAQLAEVLKNWLADGAAPLERKAEAQQQESSDRITDSTIAAVNKLVGSACLEFQTTRAKVLANRPPISSWSEEEAQGFLKALIQTAANRRKDAAETKLAQEPMPPSEMKAVAQAAVATPTAIVQTTTETRAFIQTYCNALTDSGEYTPVQLREIARDLLEWDQTPDHYGQLSEEEGLIVKKHFAGLVRELPVKEPDLANAPVATEPPDPPITAATLGKCRDIRKLLLARGDKVETLDDELCLKYGTDALADLSELQGQEFIKEKELALKPTGRKAKAKV